MIGLIVEGYKDELKIKEVKNDYHFVVLYGTKWSNKEINKIEEALEICSEVYTLSDPDEAGQWIADKIQEHFPQIKRINVDPDKAKVKKFRGDKFGIEYMSHQHLREILPLE